MLLSSLRGIIILFMVFIALIVTVRWVGIITSDRDKITAFFDDKTYCETTHCIMGIYPQQTSNSDIDDVLNSHPYVTDYEILIQFGLNIEWQWSDTAPDFMVREGFVSLNSQQVDYVLLHPTLTVGDIWVVFGAPDAVTSSIISTTLYYPQHGFNALITIDCQAYWYSPVRIEYRSERPLPSETEQFEDAVHNYCLP